MKPSTVVAIGAVLLLLSSALAVRTAVDARRPKGDDVSQLRALVQEGEAAARRRDAATISRLISEEYRDALGLRAPHIRAQVREAFRSARSVQVSVPPEQVHVEVDSNGATGSVWLRALVNTETADSRSYNDFALTLRVAKEPVRYYWLFPGAEWRVVSVEGYGGLDY